MSGPVRFQEYEDEHVHVGMIRWADGSITVLEKEDNGKEPYRLHLPPKTVNYLYTLTQARGVVHKELDTAG